MRIVWLILFLLLAGAAYYGWQRAERVSPVISTLTSPGFVGSEYHHLFRFDDAGSGIRNARVWLVAGGKTTELASQVSMSRAVDFTRTRQRTRAGGR